MELTREGSMAARVLAMASSNAEEPPAGAPGDPGSGTSPGGRSPFRAILKQKGLLKCSPNVDKRDLRATDENVYI